MYKSDVSLAEQLHPIKDAANYFLTYPGLPYDNHAPTLEERRKVLRNHLPDEDVELAWMFAQQHSVEVALMGLSFVAAKHDLTFDMLVARAMIRQGQVDNTGSS